MILPFNRLNISRKDFVLEIGSGHQPSYRSDVLCDKYLTNEERGGSLIKDRPIFIADCHNLPFKDKIFDYVISCQVLEHVKDPLRCCEELSRVGKKGYIETPTLFWEKLHPSRKYHRWCILLIDDTLVFYSKDKCEQDSVFGKLFEIMYSNSLEYHLFFQSYKKFFEIKYEWYGKINCAVNHNDDYFQSFFLKSWGTKEYKRFYSERSFSKQVVDLIGNLLLTTLLFSLRKPSIVIGNILKEYRRKKLKIDMENILACPQCKGDVRILPGEIRCLKCGAIFFYSDGIPDMDPENYVA